MRIAIVCFVVGVVGCGGGLREYDGCEAPNLGRLQCGDACQGGGVGCEAALSVALQCDSRGPSRWYSVEGCDACAASGRAGAVLCNGDSTPRTVLDAACDTGSACSMDGTTVLKCVEGHYVFGTQCESGQQCAADDAGVACH